MPSSRQFLESPDRAPLPGQRELWSEQRRAFIGVDPGASGGVAIVHDDGRAVYTEAIAVGNATDAQVCAFLRYAKRHAVFAVVESNTGYVGGAGNPGSAMFKFGVSTGKLLGYLTALEIPYELITPRTWQKALGVPARKRSQTKTQFKNLLRQRAEQLYPSAKLTLATADALLIAEYCRRRRDGAL